MVNSLFDVIIIGAGAAGLMCAVAAGKRGRKVLIIDHYKNVGEKIRISGGGRCNFTNLNETAPNLISNNSHFFISAVKRFTNFDFINLVKKHEITFHEKTLGQLFCDFSSKEIIEMLLKECAEFGVEIWLETDVLEVKKSENVFNLKTNKTNLSCESLVIATGGLSIPKIGASDFGYKIAKQFGLKIVETKPALVPFTLPEEILNKTKELSGIAVDAIVSCNGKEFKEAILFTHKGLSGPAILQISSYWNLGDVVKINLAPGIDLFLELKTEKKNAPKQDISTILTKYLPKKLAIYFCQELKIQGAIAEISDKKLQEIATKINGWKIIPNGTEGFAKAEVTKGGIDVNEISSKTFECKNVAKLYFIGEVLDVTGHLGGYNFQWAWSSGFCAGQFA